MEWYIIALLIMSAFLLLLAVGTPIAFSFGIVATFGFLFLEGPVYLFRLPQTAHESVNSFVLTAIPLFILMAEILEFTGISSDLYTAIERWIGKLRGGMAISSVLACAGFGAVSGSSAATSAAIGRIAIPEMLKRGYSKSLAGGAVSTGGTLGLMIPPSLSFIVYGFMAEQSIPRLFIAGVIPGIMLALMFSLYIFIHTTIRPSLAPIAPPTTWDERFSALWRVWAIVLVAFIILGGIYMGVFTPSEAAAAGTMVVLLLAMLYRKLNWNNFQGALLRTVSTSGFVLLIIVGAMMFASLLSIERIPRELSVMISELEVSRYLVIAAITGLFILLGMFMEGVAIMVLTVPILTPIVSSLGFDLIWFGIYMTLMVEMALITPPVGVNCFIIAGIGKDYGLSLEDTFRGILPYVGLVLLAAALITAFPEIALWLPETMR
ncbi:MAG: TRAP transporter large permease [Dehalococcoidia bacterium]|jgi:tripartite ATP-independent transporter DctM subunit|nr:TRAP transporter large permease [Dehalococcoidia bacterium]MDP6782377.1 TRAP transporter large permease [Dehalococcoidia bacterium]